MTGIDILVPDPDDERAEPDWLGVGTITFTDHQDGNDPRSVRALGATGFYQEPVASGAIATLADFLALPEVSAGVVSWCYDGYDDMEEVRETVEERWMAQNLSLARRHLGLDSVQRVRRRKRDEST